MAAELPNRELKVEDNLHYVKFPSSDGYVLASKGLTNWEQALNATTDDGCNISEKQEAKARLQATRLQ